MKFAWIDLRGVSAADRAAIVEEAVHSGVAGIVSDDAELLRSLPTNVRKVAVTDAPAPAGLDTDLLDTDLLAAADLVITEHRDAGPAPVIDGKSTGVYLRITDEATLEEAGKIAAGEDWTVVEFLQDPSKIPLEILLAATDRAEGRLITVVRDLEDAAVVLATLERGADGVLMRPRSVGEVGELARLCHEPVPDLDLVELEIVRLTHLGLGDRVCVDTCSHMHQDEGMLVGSYARGMLLVSSETHPLPYMATRPFRVNAAALHSYIVAPDNHTRYLSELTGGSEVLAVRVSGEARRVTVGRIKMETRPMLRIEARAASGATVDVITQDDWHVRLLGPGGSVHNVTELKPGDVVLGCLLQDQRHVGYPIAEFLHEQ